MGKKNAKDFVPFCADQGIPTLAGAAKAGVSVQHFPGVVMTSDGVYTFAGLGGSNMADTNYSLFVINQTDSTDPGKASVKAVTGFTIAGPDTSDVLDILVIGALKGQVTE
jgi:hypothetical protein